jgi:hypothetical protein
MGNDPVGGIEQKGHARASETLAAKQRVCVGQQNVACDHAGSSFPEGHTKCVAGFTAGKKM